MVEAKYFEKSKMPRKKSYYHPPSPSQSCAVGEVNFWIFKFLKFVVDGKKQF
jgi:hypothetical protein